MQNRLAELSRQGEWQTEMRIQMMRQNQEENPLLEFYKDDLEVCRLQIDIDSEMKIIKDGYFCNLFCYVPIFWPFHLLFCCPVSYCLLRSKVEDKARAHRLILRENSILYEVDHYPHCLGGSQSHEAVIYKQSCCAILCDGTCTQPRPEIREVFPLTAVSKAQVEKCLLRMCGNYGNVAPDTLVIRTASNPMLAAAAINSPQDGEEFCKKIMEQKAKAAPLPDDMMQKYNTYTNPAAGMMGGTMGGMMGQMQQMNLGSG